MLKSVRLVDGSRKRITSLRTATHGSPATRRSTATRRVYGNAWVSCNAEVSGDAEVYGNARVSGDAWVSCNAEVSGDAEVYGNARVSGDAWVSGDARVSCNAEVSGNAEVYKAVHLFQIGAIGSRDGFTTFMRSKTKQILVSCGCFFGTIDEFENKVKETHGDSKHAKTYMAAVELAKLQIEVD